MNCESSRSSRGAVYSSTCHTLQTLLSGFNNSPPQEHHTIKKWWRQTSRKYLNCSFRLRLISYSITCTKSKMESGKVIRLEVKIVGKVLTTDIFIYEGSEVLRGSKNVGWIYLLNKGQQNTTTNIRRKHSRSKIFQSGEMWKCSQRRIAPADDKCQNNSDKERKEENMSEQKEQQLFM